MYMYIVLRARLKSTVQSNSAVYRHILPSNDGKYTVTATELHKGQNNLKLSQFSDNEKTF